jgi:2-dehydro-3-deoxyphosphooctonate aldolase (KDO 8-P synthase)
MASALGDHAWRRGVRLQDELRQANRTSANSVRGLGIEFALPIFAKLQSIGVPVLTDVHEREQCVAVAKP